MSHRTFERLIRAGLMAALIAGRTGAAEPDEGRRLFETRIQPVLAQRCYKCHSGQSKKLEGGLHLDSASGLRRGGDSGPAVVPGKAADSLLVHALRYDGPEMPPDGKLDPEVVADFERWVRMGAPWPETPADAPHSPPLPRAYDFEQIRRTHWSLRPIVRPAVPQVAGDCPTFCGTKNGTVPLGPRSHHDHQDFASPEARLQSRPPVGHAPIDQFILERLAAAKLAPSPPADRRTLGRRVYFDLIGLPPTFEELEAFAADNAPDAYERLIDRLLASPRYGERWGRHWLDVARYSDTKGQKHQQERGFPYAYTYRDYVIRALNNDLPFDQFILEQLAADLLPTRNDPRKLAALGFLTLRNANLAPNLQIDDQIDTISRGLMGMTVACARCHDHKYDAIPTADYYSLYGVLAGSEEPEELPLLAEPAATPEYAQFKEKLDKLERDRAEFRNKNREALLTHARTSVADYLVQVAATRRNKGMEAPYISLGPDELKPALVRRWREYLHRVARADHPVFGPWHEFVVAGSTSIPAERTSQLNPLVRAALQSATPKSAEDVARMYGKLLADVYRQSQSPGERPAGFDELLALLMADDSPTNVPQSEVVKHLQRADRDRLEKFENQINTLLVRSAAAPPRAMTLIDKSRPYDPVVFTRGNPSQPGQPVLRQFLRLLSGEERKPFRDGSGRLELARAIASPENPLTARVIANRIWMHHFGTPLVSTPDDFGMRSQPPTHPALLDYLAWRLIDGGWSLKKLHREIMLSGVYRQSSADRADGQQADPENRLYWRMNRQRLELEPLRDTTLAVAGRLDGTMFGRPVELLKEPYSLRRTIYGRVDRHQLSALHRTFDFPSPHQTAALRSQTTVPQQALFMMNAPFVIEQACALAARKEIAAAMDDGDRIDALYRVTLSRRATAEEIKAARSFLKEAASAPAGDMRLEPLEQLAQVLMLTNEFVFVD